MSTAGRWRLCISMLCFALAMLLGWSAFLVSFERSRVEYQILEPGATYSNGRVDARITSTVRTYSANDGDKPIAPANAMTYVVVGFEVRGTGADGGSLDAKLITRDKQLSWRSAVWRSKRDTPPGCSVVEAGETRNCVEIFEIPEKYIDELTGVVMFDGQQMVILRWRT